jgi:cytidine deaminase
MKKSASLRPQPKLPRASRHAGVPARDTGGGPPATGSDALLAAAREAARRAYCPYSRFQVGAAILTDDDRIFTGANVENASYGLTLCAERAALLAAVHAGARRFAALAVVTRSSTPATPCGACRQVLAEFCGDSLPVLCGALKHSRVKRTTLGALLPDAFRLKGNP